MEKQSDKIIRILKSKRLRATPQRYAIYSNLLSRRYHPAAEQILTSLNEYRLTSYQAKIYSSLQALKEAGLVREVLLEESVYRYDGNVIPHHHFYSNKCGYIEDVAWEQVGVISFKELCPCLTIYKY